MSHVGRAHPRTSLIPRTFLAVISVVIVTSACGRSQPQESVIPSLDADAPRIVILPLENLGQPEDAFFAAGVTKEITNRLAAVRGLRFLLQEGEKPGQPRPQTVDVTATARGVGLVLDGSVLWARAAEVDQQLVIDARLSRVSDGVEVWSQRFVRPMSDLFFVQSAISRAVVEQLDVSLSSREAAAIDSRPTEDMDAYQEYLRGIAYSSSFESKELELAERFFERAVALDPDFAKAHAALSENHSLIFHFRYDRAPQRLAASNAAASRARELDRDLPEGHRALGYYYYWGQRNFELALSEFSLAAQGRPNDPTIFGSIGIVLRRQGRWDEALDALQRAADMEPENDLNMLELALTLARMRRYSEAVEHCRRAIDLNPDDFFPYVYLARILRARNGAVDEAREALEAMPDKDPAQQGFYLYEQAMFERDYSGAIEALGTVDEVIHEPIDELVSTRSLAECESRVLDGSAGPTVGACVSSVQYLERAGENSPADPGIHAALGWAYALTGKKEEAVTAGQRAVELSPVTSDAMAGHSYLVRLAKIYAWAEEPYLAVKTLHTALTTPGWISVETLDLDPDWDVIRDDPRFQELLKMHAEVERYPADQL